MPLWNIYHTSGIFESQEVRSQLAQDITRLYTVNGLPAFYAVIQFIPLQNGHVFVGGGDRSQKPFVRLVVEHMATHKHEADIDFVKRYSDNFNTTLKPYITDRGFDWEITVADTPRDFWRFNGIAPPPRRGEAEKIWAANGRPSEWA